MFSDDIGSFGSGSTPIFLGSFLGMECLLGTVDQLDLFHCD